jgi:hypothetical protein
MKERRVFEREIADLRLTGPVWEAESKLDACGTWTPDSTVPGKYSATLTHADAGKITVPAVYYEGSTKDVALVLGGVHGTETQGEKTTAELVSILDAAYIAKKRARCTTVIIPDLFAPKRQGKTREVGGIEPNRNFPMPGETYADVKNRGGKLLDPDQRRFKDQPPKGGGASDTMLPENIILVNLIECIKPKRLMSVHAHSAKSRTKDKDEHKEDDDHRRDAYGNDAGIFVDPRGGFDPSLEAPLSKTGRADDQFTDNMLQAAVAYIQAASFDDFEKIKKEKNAAKKEKLRKKEREDLINFALAGNVPDDAGAAKVAFQTVHYAFTAAKTRGSSLGLWAPAAGILTITVEHPQTNGGGNRRDLKSEEPGFLIKMWAQIISEKLLGLAP